MEVDDGAAVERARSGDADAFRLLVERHSRNVFRLAFRMTGNEHDAEDVVQETFLRAYRQLDKYETRSSFGTWLFRIASNYSLDLLRSRKRREDKRERSKPEQADILESMPATTPGPDRVVFSGQVQGRVEAALDELTEQERTAFVLRHFEGMSIEEIGNVLGTGTNATKHSVFRAVQKLRRSLEPLVGAAR
jgi:RNA polymerase sigma-70 factor (ECF subfamily)